MNDNDLERQLRTQAGPREDGYVPARLPMSPDAAAPRRPSPIMRAAVLVPTVAAGVLVVVVAAAAIRGFGSNGSNVGGGGSGHPTASVATSPPESGACRPDEVAMSAEPWGGAAGSRGTVISLSLVGDRDYCGLNTGFSVQITDDSGRVLAADNKDTFAGGVFLSTGADSRDHVARKWDVGIAWSDWCGDPPEEPIHLYLTFPAEWNAPKEVTVASGGSDPVPPCMGDSQQTNLSVTDLQKAE
jgi:hypothetical protein